MQAIQLQDTTRFNGRYVVKFDYAGGTHTIMLATPTQMQRYTWMDIHTRVRGETAKLIPDIFAKEYKYLRPHFPKMLKQLMTEDMAQEMINNNAV